MGKRHNILSISTFKNSKYIDCLERNLEIKNFKKEYPTQFNFMFDTFKTLIYVNNVLFSDNDFNKVEMVEKIRQYIENYLYVDYENSDKRKYSVRTLQSIFDKHSIYLYNKMNCWYDIFSTLTIKDINEVNSLKEITKEIEFEMERLEKHQFDNLINKNISYEKAIKIYDKRYLSIFDDKILPKNEKAIKEYKENFYNMFGKKLTNKEFNYIKELYNLIAKAHNGLINFNKQSYWKTINNIKIENLDDMYSLYLKSLNIEKNIDIIDKLKKEWDFLGDYINNCIYDALEAEILTFNETIFCYDMLYFKQKIQKYKINNIPLKNEMVQKLLKDTLKINKVMNENNSQKTFDFIQKIIKNNSKYFITIN